MRSTQQPLQIIRCFSSLPVPVVKLQQISRFLYKNEHIPLTRRISVVFCSDAAIRRLNAHFRKIDQATDVLSFTFGDSDLLGEIYISLQRAAAQAKEYGMTHQEEILRLFIHGFYHLVGYDHKKDTGYKEMEKKEKRAFEMCVG